MHRLIRYLATLLLTAWAAAAVAAVDLVTVPRREATQLTIYNSSDITMVREHRLLTVKPGVNRIQFAWANTLIDPTSIDFRILDHQDETELNLTGYVRVFNNSGELYDNAQTRLVVGTVNLVEKIAELAKRPAPKGAYAYWGDRDREDGRRVFKDAVKTADALDSSSSTTAPEGKPEEQKKVVKQGLSEYFLFTIEGREDIKDRQPKRLVSMKVAGVPLECIYKLTDRDGGTQFTKYYRFKNKKRLDDDAREKDLPAMENLGLSPLPDGMVRLFSEYKNKDLAYVGGTTTKYVPIGDRVEVNVGRDPDITIARRLKDQHITNVVARQYKRRLDNTYVLYYDLIDYDETFAYEEEIVSGKPMDAKVELERRFDSNVVLWGSDGKPMDLWVAVGSDDKMNVARYPDHGVHRSSGSGFESLGKRSASFSSAYSVA